MPRKTMVIVASLALVGALGALWWQVKPPVSNFNHAPIVGIGQVLADETVRALPGRGRIVVILPAGPGNSQVMPPNGLWEGFSEELKKHPNISIAATEFAALELAGLPGFSKASFKEVWEHHPDADAIVFFAGLPEWQDVSGLMQPGPAPKVLVVDLGAPPLKLRYGGYFANGILTALIGIRIDPAPPPANPKTPREFMAQTYQVYTPENYETFLNSR